MSADTGIYVAKFPEGYRVTEVVQNIENIDYYPPGTKKRKVELLSYFSNSKIYPTRELALEKAWEIYNEFNDDESEFGIGCPIEYGVSYVGEYESFNTSNNNYDDMTTHLMRWTAS